MKANLSKNYWIQSQYNPEIILLIWISIALIFSLFISSLGAILS